VSLLCSHKPQIWSNLEYLEDSHVRPSPIQMKFGGREWTCYGVLFNTKFRLRSEHRVAPVVCQISPQSVKGIWVREPLKCSKISQIWGFWPLGTRCTDPGEIDVEEQFTPSLTFPWQISRWLVRRWTGGYVNSKFSTLYQTCGFWPRKGTWCTDQDEIWYRRAHQRCNPACGISPIWWRGVGRGVLKILIWDVQLSCRFYDDSALLTIAETAMPQWCQ